jgi:hypothetical protein
MRYFLIVLLEQAWKWKYKKHNIGYIKPINTKTLSIQTIEQVILQPT